MKSLRIEAKLFLLLVPFFFIIGIIYGLIGDFQEPVGFLGFIVAGFLCALVGVYLWVTGGRIINRPEDDPEGQIAHGEGEYGTFAPHSWSPLFLGATLALAFFGLAIGWWLVIIAVPLIGVAVVLWTFEYYTGPHAQ